MAFSASDAAKLQQQLQEIERLSRLLGANINTINLQPVEANAAAIEAIFERLNNQFEGLGEETDYLVSNFQKLVGEIKRSGTGINESTKGLRALSSITEKISSYQKGYSDLSSKEINKLKDKVKIETQRLTNAKNILDAEIDELEIQKNSASFASLDVKQQQAILDKLEKNLNARVKIDQLLQNEDITLGELNNKLDIAEKEAKRIEKALGLTGIALKGISKIPILGDLLDTEEALKAASDAAKDGAGRIGAMGAAIKSLGKSFLSNLSDPAVMIGLLVKGFQKLIELGFAADKEVTDLSKSMAVSKDQASAVRDRMVEIEKTSGNLFMTTKNQVAAQLELAEAFGTTRGFTEKQIEDQVNLTKKIGMSADEAAGLQQLAMANGKTADDIIDSTIKQTAALARQTGIQLNNKKVLAEVAKVSGQLRLQYKNNPELIAKAVIQAQKLGVTLEQAANASKHLLNFEESIEDQISAELITGKELNLERARLLALNGDVAGSMQEMLSQIGSAAEFSQMNVLQQEALAKAVGMTADELANSLVQQENLNELGSNTKKQIQEQVQLLRDQGKTEEANKLMRSLGNEETAKKALEQISAQEKFNVAIEKMQSILGNIVAGPMGKLLDKLANFLSDAENIKKILTAVKAVVIGIAAAWAIMNPIGAIAGLAVAGTVMAMSDGEVNSDGLVVGKYNKGQIQPIAQGASNDNVIFTTNKPNNNVAANTNSNSNLDALIKEQQKTNVYLEKQNNISATIASRNTTVQYDSYKAGIATDVNTYKASSGFIV